MFERAWRFKSSRGHQNMNSDYDQIEEEIKEKETEEKKAKHKISGRSVFELQEIIKKKGEISKEEKNADSGEAMAGEK